MAFGKVDDNMMQCVNDISKMRAIKSGDEDQDPASSWVDVHKLSDRNKSKALGTTPVPPVKGIQHRRSIPMTARLDAKKRERNFWSWVEEVEISGYWGPNNNEYYDSEWEQITHDWDHAEKISFESGNEFKDRYGKVHNQGVKIEFVTEVINLYFRVFGHLEQFKILKVMRS